MIQRLIQLVGGACGQLAKGRRFEVIFSWASLTFWAVWSLSSTQ